MRTPCPAVGRVLTLAVLVAVPLAAPAALPESKGGSPTHTQLKEVAVKGAANHTLQTLCLDSDGRLIALVAPSRNVVYGKAASGTQTSEVQVLGADGELVTKWKVNFTGQSVSAGSGGTVFVAGNGRVARFDRDGKLLAEAEVPHLAAILKDSSALRKQAEEQLKAEVQSFEETTKQFTQQKERLTKKGEDKLTKAEKAQLQALDQNIKAYEQFAAQYKQRTVDDVLSGLTSRLRTINAVAATDKDVFIACGEVKGYGYAVWRMDAQFKDPKQVITGLGGCCGQIDIQCCGEEILVAENTRHRVSRYTRDGKVIGHFGKRGREGDPECFGSCCNPMNTCVANGVIYTSESEGYVKKFSTTGEYLGNVGMAKGQGGCKNVAIGVSPDGSRIYFCDQQKSKIIILAKNTATKAAE